MPESCKICGDPMVPPLRITSLLALNSVWGELSVAAYISDGVSGDANHRAHFSTGTTDAQSK